MGDEEKAEIIAMVVHTAAVAMGTPVLDKSGAKVRAVFEEQKPDAATIALAMTKATLRGSSAYFMVTGQILGAYLQQQLTVEHVAAQERMSKAADRMSNASWGLAAISVILAIVTYWKTFGPGH